MHQRYFIGLQVSFLDAILKVCSIVYLNYIEGILKIFSGR